MISAWMAIKHSITMDFLPTLVAVLIIWGIKEMFKLLSQNYIGV